MSRDKPQAAVKCEVPGCNAAAEFVAPGHWCEDHWLTWWDWPIESDPEPRWMLNSVGEPVS